MNIALITAGGVGNRMGQDIPKQFMTIENCPVIIYTLQSFQNSPEIDAIAVICLKGWEVILQSYANQYMITKLKWIFEGGKTNQESIYNGIKGLKEVGCKDNDIILVHDGVRPLVSNKIISENIATCQKYGAAVTGLPCKEAIMELVDGKVTKIDTPREKLIRTQPPHTYPLKTLIKLHEEAIRQNITETVASCILMSTITCQDQYLVLGSEKNGLKLTNVEDIELFKALINIPEEKWIKK